MSIAPNDGTLKSSNLVSSPSQTQISLDVPAVGHYHQPARARRGSHLLRHANPRDLCVNCRANSLYLNRLVIVFEIINVIATSTGFGALIGYVHLNWSHGTLLALLLWVFSTGLGTAIMDEYTTKPSARFATSTAFAFMMLLSIVTAIVPFVFLIIGLSKEVTSPEFSNPVADVIPRLLQCNTSSLYAEALKNKTAMQDGCSYFLAHLVPSFQFNNSLKWLAYAMTLSGMIVGLIVWFYGLYCYCMRLRYMHRIFNNGGVLECIPYQYKPSWTFLVNGQLDYDFLEEQLRSYFCDLPRCENQDLEEFIDEVMHPPAGDPVQNTPAVNLSPILETAV